MIFCLDIGNTNIAIGIYENDKLVNKFQFSTKENMTSDEYGIKLLELLNYNNINKDSINGIIISSVVPKVDNALKKMSIKYFGIEAIYVEQGIKSGIHIKVDNPKQLGADLLVGACAAVSKYGPNVLVVDMGTAMTFSYVNEKKEFLGGAILPGIRTAFKSLFESTSKLEDVAMDEISNIIGKDTKTCIQSGMTFGFASIIEGMIEKYTKVLGEFTTIITGGGSLYMRKYVNSNHKIIYDENLVLDGLRILYEKNKK